MPKQILKIDQFHGGLNSNSDPRDIADNEFSAATDVMVDELGKIRLMGGIAQHYNYTNTANNPNNAAVITPGYGLFQFSHDRVDGHLGEHLAEGDFATHAKWAVASDEANVLITAGRLVFEYDSGELQGTATQTYGDRLEAGIGGITYAFTYTVAVTTAPDGDFALTLDNFSASSTTLRFTAGTHTVTFTSHANAATSSFTITAAESSSTEGEFTIDNVSLKVYNDLDAVETGDDYLAFADTDTTANIDIYSRVANAWGTDVIDLGSTTGMKPTFYVADGSLRVSDGNFGAANETMWYGYIHRRFFGDGTVGYSDGSVYEDGLLISKWHTDEAAPKALAIKSFFGHSSGGTPDSSSPFSVDLDSQARNYQIYPATIVSETDTMQAVVTFSASSPNVTAVTQTTPGYDNFCSVGDKILIESAADAGNNTIFTVESIDVSGDPHTMDFKEAVTADDPGSTNDTVYMYNLSRSAWFDPDNTGWQCAVSTLYDDNKQESALNVSGTTLQPADIVYTTSGYHKIRFDFHIWAGTTNNAAEGLPYDHPRVSGFRLYMRRENTATWYLQAEIDMTKGSKWFGRGDYSAFDHSDEMTDCAHADGEYLSEPRQIETYESMTGISSDYASIGFDGVATGFKTAVVANRMAYVGHVKIKDKNGEKVVHGDTVLKSRANKFDSFTLDRIIEASVNDGDSIVKLEEYADRLLIFKKNKMELVNISQEIEFLEDTFMHKGVSHPVATCKTDFGIAWVNKLGCYLYDGQKVSNLLEKKGRQIIKESDWATFTANEPMIGYIPKKRQLLVVDDNTSTGTGNIFLYDMVTQSWIEGGDATFTSADLTNFVTDWNGDLVHAHTSDTGTVVKWDDTSDTSGNLSVITKDIDFGQPGVRKKIYRVYVTYKSGATTNVQVDYDVDGGTTFPYDFADGTNFTTTELDNASGWQVAELKPDVSSEANNIKSFRLRFATDGTVPAGFEINDISAVYRLKHVR